MIDEQAFKEELITTLNPRDGWKDGDKEIGQQKKIDIINHKLKIAIEIKDETIHKTVLPTPERPFVVNSVDLNRMSVILLDHIRKAGVKFKIYAKYKTILLIRTDHRRASTIRMCIDGLHTYTRDSYVGQIQTKYSHHIKGNIGCYIICNNENNLFYIPNEFCKNSVNKVSKQEAIDIFKQDILDIATN